MCGIAGILALGGPPPSIAETTAMIAAIRHRGPDEHGVYRDERCALGHARLSIIDLSTGQQPLANEDETVWVSFNGEIFDHVELRAELEAKGHRFRTRSDTEVIVHAWEEWGLEAFARFNGQWAVALWDARQRRLVLSRDRLGVRPLFYTRHGGRLYFGSEVKAIFAADAAIARALDPRAIDQTFTFWAPIAPLSPFVGIEEVEPGTTLVIDEGGAVHRHVHWEMRFPTAATAAGDGPAPFRGSLEEATEAVRHALTEATRLRMVRSDVPVGSYLSGGLDSSLVAALGVAARGERFRTFSLRFEDDEFDESVHQRAMVTHLGSDHREVVCRKRDIAEVFPDVVTHGERPILRTAPAPLFLLSRLVRQTGVKVVLTGEGADEIFAGYDLFREAKVRRFCARAPTSRLRPRLIEKLYPWLRRSPLAQQAVARQFFLRDLDRAWEPGFGHELRFRGAMALKRLFSLAMHDRLRGFDARGTLHVPDAIAKSSSLAQDQWIEVHTLLSGYLLSAQGDRVLMANSVEGRFPFLDRDVVALANTLPDDYKLRVLDEKHVLKRVAGPLLPPSIVARAKQPYRAPDAMSFVIAERPAWVDEVLDARAIADAGVFEPAAVAQLWRKCLATGANGAFSNADNMALVGVVSTQLLHEHLVRRPPRSAPIALTTLVDRHA